MASNLPTLPPFDAGSNPSEAWRHWREDFEDYIQALKYSEEPETTKTALFRHMCGEELKKQYRSFDLKPAAESTEVTLKQILDEFDKYFLDYQNEIFASFKFLEIKQEKGEKFTEYYSRLRSAVVECNYGQAMERMLRDKIIQGLSDKALQERLIRETSRKAKTVQDIISECKSAEHSKAQATEMNNENKLSVAAVKKNKQRAVAKPSRMTNIAVRDKDCNHCGRKHEPRKCPAYGTVCRKCDGKNHWAKVCRSKVHKPNTRRVSALERQDEDSDTDSVYLGELKTVDSLDTEKSTVWLQKILVNNNEILFKLDTGAQVNILPKSELTKWSNKPVIKKCKQPVLDYSDNEVPILGECLVSCETDKIKKKVKFLITTLDACPILGLQACQCLGLIKRLNQVKAENKCHQETPEMVINEFPDVFTGMGRLNRTVKIKLKENYSPHVAAPRKVPLALHSKVKEELARMEESGIITKVEEPTEWVSNMVVVNTSKKLRICLDPRPLNKAIQRPHYPIPTADNLMTKLQGSKVFTILDAKNGFWQLPLDEESSFLTTFTSPWGRYRFLVLPFGLNNAPEEFQRSMDEIFENDPQVNPYFDDIALGSPTIAEHCILLRRTLENARKANLKFNIEKTQLALTSVNYLGHIMSNKGIKPDPRKIKAINEFAEPKCREDLQRFLGMVTYLAKFTPHLSNLTHSMRQLLKKDSDWLWDANTEKDFQNLKQEITQAPCLQYFDDSKPVTVSVDASKNGLGAVLLQEGKPVAFGSAALTETQQRYAQIEKELLAVIYGLEHFNYYTYGRKVIVQTDHKPLLGLSSKHYDMISPRLQRLLLRLNRYDIQLVYIPGKHLLIADALSRAYSLTDKFEDIEEEKQENGVTVNLLAQATTTKWEVLAELTRVDPELQEVSYYMKNGWPEKKNTKAAAQPYWHCKEELYFSKEGVICRGQRLVVPSAARDEILEKLHVSHRGIVACKSKARVYFYWPNINKDVETFVNKCKICQQLQRNNQKEVLLDQNLPSRPWQKVACDFYYLRGQQYILIIDYFSKFVELKHMKSNTAQTVINVLKPIFARHGIPEEFVSDGGPPFNSEKVQNFFKDWNITHFITSPYNPRSNGQVERSVQTLKRSLTKAAEDGKDLNLVLLDYRTQPSSDLPSPAELLMGRRLRSILPSHPACLKPKFPIARVTETLKKRQEIQNKHANRHAKKHPELQTGAKVWFKKKPNEQWIQGIIIRTGPQPRSYLIKGRDGDIFRRNRFHIRPDFTTCNNEMWTRTVEDFYSSTCDGKPTTKPNSSTEPGILSDQPNSSSEPEVNCQQTMPDQPVRKSNRTVLKPLRYRDN